MPESEASHWKTTNEMADFFGITKQTFVKVRSKYVAPEHKRKRGREVEWYSPGVVQAWIDHEVDKQRTKPEFDDPDMAGENTPWLEEFRRLRCKGLELDLAEREGSLVPIDEFKQWLGPIVSAFRGVLERIKTTAPDVHEMLNEVIQRFKEEVDAGDN